MSAGSLQSSTCEAQMEKFSARYQSEREHTVWAIYRMTPLDCGGLETPLWETAERQEKNSTQLARPS